MASYISTKFVKIVTVSLEEERVRVSISDISVESKELEYSRSVELDISVTGVASVYVYQEHQTMRVLLQTPDLQTHLF